jgi:hypothetical protein
LNNTLVVRELDRLREQHRQNVKNEVARGLQSVQRDLAEYKRQAEEFEKNSGMRLTDWHLGNVGKLARAIADLHKEGYGSMRATLQQQAGKLRETSQRLEDALSAMPADGEMADG